MNEITAVFLNNIAAMSPELFETYTETIEYWSPEDPPATVVYAEIGRRLADEFDRMDQVTRYDIFNLIEIGVKSDDEALGTAVATGLIEGLVGRSARRENWTNVKEALGPVSRSHADAWYGN